MLPQTSLIPIYGTFKFIFGDKTLELKDCKVDLASAHKSDQGVTWSLKIFDRRWRWKHGAIWGEYNITDSNDDFIPRYRKKTQDLVLLLLKEMNEEADVSRVPNEEYIYTNWDGSNPAFELESLCHKLGCTVVLNLDSTISIHKLGQGASLPEDPQISNENLTIDITDAPDFISVVGGETILQCWMKLRAVVRM
jgi:hypothetical protein